MSRRAIAGKGLKQAARSRVRLTHRRFEIAHRATGIASQEVVEHPAGKSLASSGLGHTDLPNKNRVRLLRAKISRNEAKYFPGFGAAFVRVPFTLRHDASGRKVPSQQQVEITGIQVQTAGIPHQGPNSSPVSRIRTPEAQLGSGVDGIGMGLRNGHES